MKWSTMTFVTGLATAAAAQGAIMWQADLSGLTAGSQLTSDRSGKDNTFFLEEKYRATVVSGDAFGTGTGNQLKVEPTEPNWFLKVGQIDAGDFGAGTVMVASFDLKRSGVADSTFKLTAVRDGNTSTAVNTTGVFNTNVTNGAARRFTLVVNQTGHDIALPGTLGTLPTGNMQVYSRDAAGIYYNLDQTVLTAGKYTGFYFRPAMAEGKALLLDNFVITDSVSDKLGSSKTPVLELMPGTVIPEPASAGVLGAAGLGVLARRRRR